MSDPTAYAERIWTSSDVDRIANRIFSRTNFQDHEVVLCDPVFERRRRVLPDVYVTMNPDEVEERVGDFRSMLMSVIAESLEETGIRIRIEGE